MNLSEMTISQLETETVRFQGLLAQCETSMADARAHLAAVRAELEKRRRPAIEPRISDHALLRYLERVMDVDISSLKLKLLTADVKDAIRAGASAVVVEGVRFKVQDNTIVTVMDTAPKQPKRMRRDRDLDDGPSLSDGLKEYYLEASDSRGAMS